MTGKYRFKKNLRLFADNGINLLLLSILTGLFAGVVITFYNLLMSQGEETSQEFYNLFLEHPAFIPLLFLALAAGALLIGTMVKLVPMIRGSGIPQIEGAARGVVRFKWYVTLCSMFAASLACVVLGYPAGAEGPSLEMGGCAGSAVSQLLRRNFMVRRLQIAAGSSAGLAVAFNAPVTGLVFALEEAFRSFSPQVFICAAVSVVTSLFTRNAIRLALNLPVTFAFTEFEFTFAFNAQGGIFCLWTALASFITALAGVGFYYLVFACKKLFRRIKFLKGVGKYIIPFTLAGAFGLITVYSLGGGHSLIDALATGGSGAIDIKRVFGLGIVASLFIIVIIRFITAVLTMGCGVPCGVFIPMLAIGAGIGAILSLAFQKGGMDGAYSDYLVIICMAAFFTCIVKAPVTGVVMVFELTGQFANLLPAIIGVVIGYLVGMLFKTEGIYEKNLAQYIEDENIYDSFKKVRVNITVMPHSRAEGSRVRSIIWPANGLVVERVTAEGEVAVPDGETILCAGDRLTFECETD
ncbi:MAG: chloride channel protein, partial [Clostridia bacterium]|nr:chloride channel protein [Clostridia bacterium]